MPRGRKAKNPTESQSLRQGASANPKGFKGSKGVLRSIHAAMKSLRVAEEAIHQAAGTSPTGQKKKKTRKSSDAASSSFDI